MSSKKKGSILIVDDDEDVLQAARLLLKQNGVTVHTEKNPDRIPGLLKSYKYDVVLLDMNFHDDVSSGEEGFYWLQKIRETDPSISVILITAYGDIDKAVKAVKEGATDFVLKPWQNEKLVTTVLAALKLTDSLREVATLKEQQLQLSAEIDHHYKEIIGRSPAMLEVLQMIEKVAATEANVLILGENGTGKELIARALHRRSNRRERIFVNVDMGAIPETLFESDLFGYKKGAFTDAKEDKAGRFEVAHGGTLFLDEIGNIPLNLQSKLLTVIQNRKVTRVGAIESRPIDIRLVCATNKPLQEMVKEGDFREDLLYRINTIEIHLPPLRDRREDIETLVEHYVKLYASKYKKTELRVSKGALQKLEGYGWPGNIRELQHAIERAVIMTSGDKLTEEDFLLVRTGSNKEASFSDDLTLEELEKAALKKALQKHKGNITKTAEELGLTRASVYRRIEKFGL